MTARILFTIPNFMTAGSGRAMLNVIERLDRSAYSPAVCVSRRGGELCNEVERMGIPMLEAPFTVAPRPLVSLPFRAWACAQPFRPHRFHLWHSFHYLDDYTEPMIARLSGARAWVYTKKNMNWRQRSWYIRTLLASKVAAQNTTMLRDFFGSRLFKDKVTLVAPGVDHEMYQPEGGSALGLRQKLGLGPDVPVVCVVANLLPVKGHPTVIKAIAEVPDAHLCLAGKPLDSEYVRSLENCIAGLGVGDRVHFLGGVTDVPALLRETDVFVLSTVSKGEGCPVALLEAMSSGRACVASRVSGCIDVIQHGANGLLVEPENVTALADALRELCSSLELRRDLGRQARRRIETDYTMERETAQYDSLYRSALGFTG